MLGCGRPLRAARAAPLLSVDPTRVACGGMRMSPGSDGEPGDIRAPPSYIEGMRTVSMRYTVALAVCTPPQMTLASLTMMSSPLPVTVTSLPCTVV